MSNDKLCADPGELAEYSLTARRNSSLSPAGRYRVFCFICLVAMAIASAFTLLGAWLVLPFAGLEMAVLYLAFRYMDRHSEDFERITIKGDRMLLEIREGSETRSFEFHRYWAQVMLERDSFGALSRLAFRSHGREVEFGRSLTCEERATAAREIRKQLGH